MIKITVTGETKLMSITLKLNGFQWKPKPKEWVKIVSESNLDKTLDSIRPEIAKIYIKLQKVDVHGNPLSPDILRFCLTDMDRSVSVLGVFIQSSPSPVHSSDPINPKKEWKKLPGVDKGFF